MGKPTGFMEFERLEEGYEPVEKRLTHYKEFVQTLSDDQAKTQGADHDLGQLWRQQGGIRHPTGRRHGQAGPLFF